MAESGVNTDQCDYMKCEKHPDKRVEIYCEHHVVVCCSSCAWKDHHECKPKPCQLEEAMQKFQDEGESLMDELMTCTYTCDKEVKRLSSQVKEGTALEKSVRDEVTYLKTAVLAKLDDFEHQLENDIQENLSNQTKELMKSLAESGELKNSLQQIKHSIQNHLKKNCPEAVAAFVQFQKLYKALDFETKKETRKNGFQVSKEIHNFLNCSSFGKFITDSMECANVQLPDRTSGEGGQNIDKDEQGLMSDVIQDNKDIQLRSKQEKSNMSFGKIFRLFKFRSNPELSANESTTNPNSLPLAVSGKIEDEEWFHGGITGAVANSRLIGNGDFLLRAKPNQDLNSTDYVLSVCSKIQHHAIIKSVKGEWKFKGKRFATIQALIKHLHCSMMPLISSSHNVILHTPVSSRPWKDVYQTSSEAIERLPSCLEPRLDDYYIFGPGNKISRMMANQQPTDPSEDISDVEEDISDVEEDKTSPYELWAPPLSAAPTYEYCCDISEIGWFHGGLMRENAEKRLETDGDFLVREHREDSIIQYILSVYWGGHRHFKYKKTLYDQPHNPVEYFIGTEAPIKPTTDVRLLKPILKEKWEIRNNDCIVKEKINEGSFGNIHKGLLKSINKEAALNLLKENVSEDDKKVYLGAAQVQHQLNHPNVVKCFGIAMDYDPIVVVMEYMPGGPLLDVLRNKQPIDDRRKIGFCADAANALAYLEETRIIHRDVAARNFYLGCDGIIKLSDFTLCKRLDSLQTSDKFKIAIKWTAPEYLISADLHGYCTKSDLWSFGVLVWEIFSNGRCPYPGWTDKETFNRVLHEGYRMPPPPNTPVFIEDLITRCWAEDPNRRPHAKTILSWLKSSLEEISLETFKLPSQSPPKAAKRNKKTGQSPVENQKSAITFDSSLAALKDEMRNRPLPPTPPTAEKKNKQTSANTFDSHLAALIDEMKIRSLFSTPPTPEKENKLRSEPPPTAVKRKTKTSQPLVENQKSAITFDSSLEASKDEIRNRPLPPTPPTAKKENKHPSQPPPTAAKPKKKTGQYLVENGEANSCLIGDSTQRKRPLRRPPPPPAKEDLQEDVIQET